MSAKGHVRYTSETVPTASHKSPIFSLGDLDNISNIPSTGNNFRQGDVCQTSHVFGGYGQVDNGVYRPYVRNESISYASRLQAQNFNMVQNLNFDRPQSNSIFETSRPSTSYVGADRSSFNHSCGNTSMRVKEPTDKMPTFDPKSNNCVRIQYPCSLGSVNSDFQSSRDVLVSFRILVCMLWSEFSNRTASFSMSAGQHWSCNM